PNGLIGWGNPGFVFTKRGMEDGWHLSRCASSIVPIHFFGVLLPRLPYLLLIWRCASVAVAGLSSSKHAQHGAAAHRPLFWPEYWRVNPGYGKSWYGPASMAQRRTSSATWFTTTQTHSRQCLG